MKFKPTQKHGGMVVELDPKEGEIPMAPSETPLAPIPEIHIGKILVPIDFSEGSRKALRYAIAFAKQFNAQVVLVHSTDPYVPASEAGAVDVGNLREELINDARKDLDELQADAGDLVPVKTILRIGNPAKEIHDAALEETPDLIILSSHCRTGMARVLLGSTAEQIVRHAGCPVLVIREKEQEIVTG